MLKGRISLNKGGKMENRGVKKHQNFVYKTILLLFQHFQDFNLDDAKSACKSFTTKTTTIIATRIPPGSPGIDVDVWTCVNTCGTSTS